MTHPFLHISISPTHTSQTSQTTYLNYQTHKPKRPPANRSIPITKGPQYLPRPPQQLTSKHCLCVTSPRHIHRPRPWLRKPAKDNTKGDNNTYIQHTSRRLVICISISLRMKFPLCKSSKQLLHFRLPRTWLLWALSLPDLVIQQIPVGRGPQAIPGNPARPKLKTR